MMCSRGLSADKKPGHCDLDSVLKCDLPLPGEILDTVNAKQEVNVCMQQVSPGCGFDRAANTYWLEESPLSTSKHKAQHQCYQQQWTTTEYFKFPAQFYKTKNNKDRKISSLGVTGCMHILIFIK